MEIFQTVLNLDPPFHVRYLSVLLENIRKPKVGCQMFSGGIERDQWHELG